MPLLFSYGTLQDKTVQRELFGRILVGRKDDLPGFTQTLVRLADADFARTSGKTHHAILRPAGNAECRIPGTVLEVTDAELDVTDRYEPAEYRRVIASLASGRQAWVYIDAAFAGNADS